MKLSSNTINILKNFSTINSSIQFKKGDKLTTLAPNSVIFSEAKLEEEFPRDFAIYDLPKFLGIQNLMQEPEFDFKEDYLLIKSTNKIVKFLYSPPTLVKSFYEKIDMPKTNNKVIISENDLKSLLKASAVMHFPHLCISGGNNNVLFTVLDMTNSSLGSFVIKTDQTFEKDFEVVLKTENLKMIDGEYDVLLTPDIVNFKHTSGAVQYWIAAEDKA